MRMSFIPKPGWSSLSRSDLKVPGGGVVGWGGGGVVWLRPNLVFSLSLISQAEQLNTTNFKTLIKVYIR